MFALHAAGGARLAANFELAGDHRAGFVAHRLDVGDGKTPTAQAR